MGFPFWSTFWSEVGGLYRESLHRALKWCFVKGVSVQVEFEGVDWAVASLKSKSKGCSTSSWKWWSGPFRLFMLHMPHGVMIAGHSRMLSFCSFSRTMRNNSGWSWVVDQIPAIFARLTLLPKKQTSQLPGPSTFEFSSLFPMMRDVNIPFPTLVAITTRVIICIKPCILKGTIPLKLPWHVLHSLMPRIYGSHRITTALISARWSDRATCAPSLHRPRDFPLQAWSRNPRENVDSLGWKWPANILQDGLVSIGVRILREGAITKNSNIGCLIETNIYQYNISINYDDLVKMKPSFSINLDCHQHDTEFDIGNKA